MSIILKEKSRNFPLSRRAGRPGVSSIGLTTAGDVDAEQDLSDYWNSFRAREVMFFRHMIEHPSLLVKACKNFAKLDRIEARLSRRPAAQAIKSALVRRNFLKFFSLARTGACILKVPELPELYSQGASKQTLRRKSRAAVAAGVTWRPVDDLAEQRRLVAVLDEELGKKSDPLYRQVGCDHQFLVGFGMWTGAFARTGEPLAIAVTPHDGQWAVLTAFLTLGDSKQHSDTRYYLTQVVVERLSVAGVRYLADTRGPAELNNGLRFFQRMMGFRIARVRISDRP